MALGDPGRAVAERGAKAAASATARPPILEPPVTGRRYSAKRSSCQTSALLL